MPGNVIDSDRRSSGHRTRRSMLQANLLFLSDRTLQRLSRSEIFSTPPYSGTLIRYHAHPAAWLHPLPDNISFEEGALLEPLSVALAAVTRAELSLGMSTLICGAGPIGLVTLLCAAAAGCEPLIITDLDAGRLEWAKKLVPRVHAVQVFRKEQPKEIAEKIKPLGGSEGIQSAMECTGVESSVSAAIYVPPLVPHY